MSELLVSNYVPQFFQFTEHRGHQIWIDGSQITAIQELKAHGATWRKEEQEGEGGAAKTIIVTQGCSWFVIESVKEVFEILGIAPEGEEE